MFSEVFQKQLLSKIDSLAIQSRKLLVERSASGISLTLFQLKEGRAGEYLCDELKLNQFK